MITVNEGFEYIERDQAKQEKIALDIAQNLSEYNVGYHFNTDHWNKVKQELQNKR